MTDIASFFDRYGWVYEELEPALWRSSFFTETEEEYDLYVMLVDDWVHFAVSPVLPPVAPEAVPRLHRTLLTLNQQLRLVSFALDGDGDVNLVASAPAQQISYHFFVQIVQAFVFYTDRLASELRRMATDPAYYSPLVG
ncbi:MAG: YbjN domain-containing protein [Caldilineaceae bacterium]|nr:YbjN domain-containing protein [Caldilineaceae bacterium]